MELSLVSLREEPASPEPEDVDWISARNLFAPYIRHREPAWPPDVHEDLVQEALIRLFRMSLREPIRKLEAVANTIADSVVADKRRTDRRRQLFLKRLALEREVRPASNAADNLGDPADRLYFLVIAYFEKIHAPCADLAQQYFSNIQWKALAESRGRSSTGLRRLWSRCTARLRRAFGGDDGPLRWWFDE